MKNSRLREIIFDTETTGLSPRDGDRIIEIGAIELINQFPTGKIFHKFINADGRAVDPGALKVHGISDEQLADKPVFASILDEFLEFFAEGMLVAHNAAFDMGFINAELARLDHPPFPPERIIDTLQIARRKHPAGPNSLDALCKRYSIDNSHREKHGALLDSELLAEVYIELLGGRQATFALDTQPGGDNNNLNPAGMQDGSGIIKRPNPLPPALSADDIRKHQDFIETLGDNCVWKKTSL